MDAVALAERVVKQVMKLGPSDCDVVVTDSVFTTAEIEKSSIKQSSAVSDPGVGIRAFKKGASGFSCCTGLSASAIRGAARLAVSQANSGTPDPDFHGLPESAKPTRVAGLFEPKLSLLESDDVVSMAIALSDRAGDDKRISSVNAGVSVATGSVALANSNGFAGHQRLSSFEIAVESVARSGDSMFSGADGAWSRRLDSKAMETVAANAREHAILGLDQTGIETGDYPVVVDPLAAGFILMTAIGEGASAESIQRKRSYLTDLLGKRVGSERFSIVDDPTVEWANGSFAFDGEGIPARKKSVIDKGVLSSFLYDSYTAGRDSVKSTGNSSRGGSMWTFRRPPSISSTNLVVKRGDSTVDEMVQETRKGVFLRVTYDYPNLATGEFSGLIMEGFKIEKGELGPCIRQATMGISLLELFQRIDMVGRHARDAYGVRVPPLRISKAKIAGSS